MTSPFVKINNDGNGNPLLKESDLYIIFTFFGFVLGVLLFIFFTPNYYTQDEPVHFVVPRGAGMNSVIDSLYEEKIIPSRTNMKVAAFLYGAEANIKAGRYSIPNGLSYLSLVELLVEGAPDEQKLVTIPEGIWQHNLAGLLQRELDVDSTRIMELSGDNAFLSQNGIHVKSMEGYLLTNTFYFYTDVTEEEVLLKLKSKMDAIFEADSVKRRMNELGMSKHEVLTLASVIEGETNIFDEFKKISGVYHNRLNKGIALQADPTVQYLIRHRKRYNRILYKDLEIDSPYNTYKYAGLPPGPINNPGKEAVLAALFPEQHSYYYFVADGTGGHVFAKTLSEHNRNVANYRRWRARQ